MFFLKKYVYITGIILLIMSPILLNLDLLLFGEKVNGKVVGNKSVRGGKRIFTVSVIEFEIDGNIWVMNSPNDYVLAFDNEYTVFYDKTKNSNMMIFDFGFLYLRWQMIFVFLLIIVWTVAYYTMTQMKKEKKLKINHNKVKASMKIG